MHYIQHQNDTRLPSDDFYVYLQSGAATTTQCIPLLVALERSVPRTAAAEIRIVSTAGQPEHAVQCTTHLPAAMLNPRSQTQL